MIDSFTMFSLAPRSESTMKQNCVAQVASLPCGGALAASYHVTSRIFYPGHVRCLDNGLMSLTCEHAFEAVYLNALGFLEKLEAEENFQ